MTIVPLLLAATEPPAPLVAPNWVFPLIAAIIFLAVALVTFSYRDVANRHSDKVPAGGDAHGHGADAGHH